MSAVDPRIFPGTAALYVSWFADDSLDGRRVYFTEPNVELRRQIASLPAARIGELLVAPEDCPPRTAGATTWP
jgi:hypothetical protein